MALDDLNDDDLRDLVGRKLDNGHYILEQYLDRGNFGAVFKATDTRLNEVVAIKVGQSHSNFMREARLAAKVRHKNVVRVSDYGRDNGLAFLVMEYLQGEDLESVFNRQGCRLTVDQLMQLVSEVGDALAFAHEQDLIHRDLKPRNIFLRNSSGAAGVTGGKKDFVLLDFGIATKLDSTGATRNATQDGAGTIEYMAPETLERKESDARSDLYSFGVILYQMMTGRVPFPQSGVSIPALSACCQAIVGSPPPPFGVVAPDRIYPKEVENLVIQCLSKDSQKRPQSISEVQRRCLETLMAPAKIERMPDDPRDLVGHKFGDRYVIDSYIKHGENVAVYQGTDTNLKKTVALKVGDSSGQILNEARQAARLEHRHIVRITDSGTEGGLAFLVMESLQGQDLETLFRAQNCRLSVDQLIQLVCEVGDALASAHADHLAHCDLRPQKIFLREQAGKSGITTRKSDFVLLDFGVATHIDPPGTIADLARFRVANIEYAAPELLDKNPEPTPASDLYAFGVILYQMMTGRVPFPQVDASKQVFDACRHAIARTPPPTFSKVAPGRAFPNGVEDLVLRCLGKLPGQRPQSISEVQRQFVELLRPQTFSPEPVAPEFERMPSDPRELVGNTIGGRYVIDEFLKKGAYGAVFRGTDMTLQKTVALKVGESSNEILNEARLAARLEHHHIMQVTDSGVDRGLAFLVMEYLQGQDLETLFRGQDSCLSDEQLIQLIREGGDALAFAHAENVVHCDLKPQKIFLRERLSKSGITTRKSEFVLRDFGIASYANTAGGMPVAARNGTVDLRYVAPELLGNAPRPNVQSDIYSFGAILYQMMTGRAPFPQSDDSPRAVALCKDAIINTPASPFCKVASDRSFRTGVEELVIQCLKKRPDQRPKSVSEVQLGLLKVLCPQQTDSPVTVSPPTERMPEDPRELLGRKLGDRYVIDAFINSGGFGAVYRGTDTLINKTVAIKVGDFAKVSDGFSAEAKLAARLRHHHILSITDIGNHNGLAYLVMEYLEGENLESLFKAQNFKLKTPLLCKFVDEIGDALAFAHRDNLIHRDLKPSNIILNQHAGAPGEGSFVLVDFGIAAKVDAKGTVSNIQSIGCGTPDYMAPELLGESHKRPQSTIVWEDYASGIHPKEHTATPQSDIYSFGVILYQLMTGGVPFSLSTYSHDFEHADAIRNAVPPKRKEFANYGRNSAKLEALVMRCLEKDPDRRPRTMDEVRNEFLRITKPIPPGGSRFRLVAAFALVTAVSVLIAREVWPPHSNSMTAPTLTLEDGLGHALNDDTVQTLGIRDTTTFTVQVTGLPEPEIDVIPENVVEVAAASHPIGNAVEKTFTIRSKVDPNAAVKEVRLVFRAGSGQHSKQTSVRLTINCEPWLPNGTAVFKLPEDARLREIGNVVYATVLSRVIDDKSEVRFRLIPGSTITDVNGESIEVSTFYAMEDLVTNQQFANFLASHPASKVDLARTIQMDKDPVATITAMEAQLFAWWLAGGSGGALPSTTEWEFASGYWDRMKKDLGGVEEDASPFGLKFSADEGGQFGEFTSTLAQTSTKLQRICESGIPRLNDAPGHFTLLQFDKSTGNVATEQVTEARYHKAVDFFSEHFVLVRGARRRPGEVAQINWNDVNLDDIPLLDAANLKYCTGFGQTSFRVVIRRGALH